MALLLSSSVLMLVSFLLMTNSYKNIHRNNQIASSELSHKQKFWKAEGGLNCAANMLQTSNDLTNVESSGFFDACSTNNVSISAELNEENNTMRITSDKDNIRVNARFAIGEFVEEEEEEEESGGMFPPLIIYGEKTVLNSSGGSTGRLTITRANKCAAIETTDTSFSAVKQHNTNSVDSFNILNIDDDCRSKTNMDLDRDNNTYAVSGIIGNDVRHIEGDLFNRLFNVTNYQNSYNNVRNTFFGGSMGSTTNCARDIMQTMNNNKREYWVDGHCSINANDSRFMDLVNKSKELGGIVVFVTSNYDLTIRGTFNGNPDDIPELYGSFIQYGPGQHFGIFNNGYYGRTIIENIRIQGVVANGSGNIEIGDNVYIGYNEEADFLSRFMEASYPSAVNLMSDAETRTITKIKGSWNDLQ